MKNILKSKKFATAMAMVLMVAMVVGMGTITYSRYVTSKGMDTPEQATVAEWGYVLTINQADMFGTAYEGNAVNETFEETNDDKIDVKSKATADLVAPGTSGSMSITLSGNAEVLAALTFDVTDNSHDVLLTYGDGQTYAPIKWTLTKKVGDTTTTLATANTTFALMKAALEAESAKVEAGTTIPTTVYTISWSWALGSADANDQNNKLDTALGMLQAGKTADEIEEVTGIVVNAGASETTLYVDLSASVAQIQD